MAKKNQNNNIDKAMEALQGALDIEPVGQEIQLPEQAVDFESDVELIETPDGGAEVGAKGHQGGKCIRDVPHAWSKARRHVA